MQWKGNPIDVEILEPIAKTKIPIMHAVGDADTAVPMNENTTILKEHYEKLGGHVELIVKKGVGHHPIRLAIPRRSSATFVRTRSSIAEAFISPPA